MTGLSRKWGVLGLLLGAGLACTQLFGPDRENTLAPDGELSATGGLSRPGARAGEGRCAEGQVRCSGALLQRCASDQRSWITVQRCAAAALCQQEPASCRPAACGADEMTCAGEVLQRCNAERTGWDVFATCASPTHCNADRRSCLAEPCAPGELRCGRSERDEAPQLEVCDDAREGWQPLSPCASAELCAETLSAAQAGGIVIGEDGMPQAQGPTSTDPITECLEPRCAAGELRCEGAELQVCAEGLTGFVTAEQCATAALCQNSVMAASAGGLPACLPPLCAPGEHRCTDAGLLQVCSEERTGFRLLQSCPGPAFCNAALADQGLEGCTAAPCEAGHLLCNGASIQQCREDRTGFDDTGIRCESAELCNDNDPPNAHCEEPACRRGATSADEFRCEGAELERCNESLTGYELVETCLNPALCDPSLRFEGCLPPACRLDQHTCREEVLQRCKPDQTGFEDVESCASPAACDAAAGRCADLCELGAVRCNASSGDLEECRDPQLGWQVIGDCASAALCDAERRTCRAPVCAVAGQRRCESRGGNPVITRCSPERDRFDVITTCSPGDLCDAQNNECDRCQPGSRRCEGDTLVVCDPRGQSEARTECASGCATVAGLTRCLACGPDGSARCSGSQLFVCEQGPEGEHERSEPCSSEELCQQTLEACGRGLEGQACQCNPGVCQPGQLRCDGDQLQRCNPGLTGFDTIASCGPGLCNMASGECDQCSGDELRCADPSTQQQCVDGQLVTTSCPLGCEAGRCASCNVGQCDADGFRACVDGQLAAPVACADTDRNPCAGGACDPSRGCIIAPEPAGTSCSDNDACNGDETCDGKGICVRGMPVSCPGTECRPSACNGATGACEPFNAPDGTPCRDGTAICVDGECSTDRCGGTCNLANLSAAERECTAAVVCDDIEGTFACNGRPAASGTPCTTESGDPGACDGDRFTQAACMPNAPAPSSCTGSDASPCPQPEADDVCSVPACVNDRCTFVGPPEGTPCSTSGGAAGFCDGGQGAGACQPIIIQ